MKPWLALTVLLCAGAAFFIVREPKTVLRRTNVLVGTSPVSVWSWDKHDRSFTVVVLPADIATDNSRYGRYSLEALWKLGFIDKKEGLVLARSLSDAVAIPVPWFIGEGDELVPTADIENAGRTLFSPGGLVPILLGRRPSNMPLITYFSFVWALQKARPDTVRMLDLTASAAGAGETLPDGTVRQFLDTQRIDVVLKGTFEDEAIRAEGITVAIYNTTATPALGTYAARLLSGQGILVVAVGNSEPEVGECSLEGTESALKTKTARVIAELFVCRPVTSTSQERADLVVRLGSVYATQFSSDE